MQSERSEARVPFSMTLSVAPPDITTCMHYTGIDPFTGDEV